MMHESVLYKKQLQKMGVMVKSALDMCLKWCQALQVFKECNQRQVSEMPTLSFVGRCGTFSLDVNSVSLMKFLCSFCRCWRKGYNLSVVWHLCLLRKGIVLETFLECVVAIQYWKEEPRTNGAAPGKEKTSVMSISTKSLSKLGTTHCCRQWWPNRGHRTIGNSTTLKDRWF